MLGTQRDIDSIIFDLDGTLWDATKEIANSWSKVLIKNRHILKEITEDELKGYMGLRLEEIAEKMLPDVDKKERENLMKECGKYENIYLKESGAKLYDKIEETLDRLYKKYKLFIVSNCQDGYIETFLEYNDFYKYFKDFECPGRTNLDKSENIKLIVNRNALKNPIYVGDTHMDGESARKAGIPFVFARYGFGNTEEYNHVIDNFSELLYL